MEHPLDVKMTMWSRSHVKNGCHVHIRYKLFKSLKGQRPWVLICSKVGVGSYWPFDLFTQGSFYRIFSEVRGPVDVVFHMEHASLGEITLL